MSAYFHPSPLISLHIAMHIRLGSRPYNAHTHSHTPHTLAYRLSYTRIHTLFETHLSVQGTRFCPVDHDEHGTRAETDPHRPSGVGRSVLDRKDRQYRHSLHSLFSTPGPAPRTHTQTDSPARPHTQAYTHSSPSSSVSAHSDAFTGMASVPNPVQQTPTSTITTHTHQSIDSSLTPARKLHSLAAVPSWNGGRNGDDSEHGERGGRSSPSFSHTAASAFSGSHRRVHTQEAGFGQKYVELLIHNDHARYAHPCMWDMWYTDERDSQTSSHTRIHV